MSGSLPAPGATLAVVLAALTLGGTAAWSAGTISDYRLLILDGSRAKWGTPELGAGARMTYAIATGPLRSPGVINCGEVRAPEAMLDANAVSRGEFDAALESAFAAWAAVAEVSFLRVSDPDTADIVIGAQGTPVGRAFTNVATATASRARMLNPATMSGKMIRRSLICLNPDQPWKIGFDGNLNSYDLRYTLMHEIGHAIGLDHPDSPNAVMDFHYTEAFSTLQPGDIAGAVALYGPPHHVTVVAAEPAASPAPITPVANR